MSTDWSIACPACRVKRHLGQSFMSGPSLGYGSDDKDTPLAIAAFIDHHLIDCAEPLIVVNDDSRMVAGFKDVDEEDD